MIKRTDDSVRDYHVFSDEQERALAQGLFTAEIQDVCDELIPLYGVHFDLHVDVGFRKVGFDSEPEIISFDLKRVRVVLQTETHDFYLDIKQECLNFNNNRLLIEKLIQLAEIETLRKAKLLDDSKWEKQDEYF
jgi:hypothetical protein